MRLMEPGMILWRLATHQVEPTKMVGWWAGSEARELRGFGLEAAPNTWEIWETLAMKTWKAGVPETLGLTINFHFEKSS